VSVTSDDVEAPDAAWRPTVKRTTPASRIALIALFVFVVLLALVPSFYGPSATNQLVQLFILVIFATMWNLLAGYGGMISVGQQAFIGFGSYTVLYLSLHGVNAWVGIAVAGAAAAVLAVPVSFLVFRLRGGYFAIGTWVVAEALRLIVSQFSSLGGGAGASLNDLSNYSPDVRQAITYWVALGAMVAMLLVVAVLLRRPVGLGLTAIRDAEVAAGAVGVPVVAIKRVVYLLAAAGCGLAGGLLLTNQLAVQPDSAFSVQYSAFMIFMVIIGGVGTLEGPVIGALVFFEFQKELSSYGTWYLIALGALAIIVTLRAPRGLWGLIDRGRGVSVVPLRYRVATDRPANR
jgi:branched-chain amino acid transport system permease protein